ncbi:flagellar export chaperone FliS [Paraconexibacter sp.]|uniref:flagellar export chaperone FliS n=1 Tax=Paraconexibacter sp. TaxID=2949640 RepID=UPI0035678EEE
MNPYARPQAYRESSVLTASPEQLVVMLYDGALRFLRQSEAAFGEEAYTHGGERMARAEAIIDELLATLDMGVGELAERLQAIYVFCKRQLIDARLERDATKIRTVIRLLDDLRDAWAQLAAGGGSQGPSMPPLVA